MGSEYTAASVEEQHMIVMGREARRLDVNVTASEVTAADVNGAATP